MLKNLEKWLSKNVKDEKANKKDVGQESHARTNQVKKNQSNTRSSFPQKGRNGHGGLELKKKVHSNVHPNPHQMRAPQKLVGPKGKKMSVTALGGLEGVGEKNMFLIEFEGKILIIDMGWAFPDDTLPGIDFIIPDISPLKGREKDIVGVVFTHGHLDHIGAVPFLIPKLNYPQMYAMPWTATLIKERVSEFPGVKEKMNLKEFSPEDILQLGPFKIGFFRVAHNIADGVGMAIRTEAGLLLHTGDFKLDHTPADGKPTDVQRMAYFGAQGVDLMIFDSTGAAQKGQAISEKTVGENLEKLIDEAKGRVVMTTFSGLLSRHQQVINAAEKNGRKILLSGRSMLKAFELARKQGFLKVKDDTVHDIKNIHRFKDERIVLITTGSQGEPRSALQRIAEGVHPQIKIKKGDTVIFSNSVVPGNERSAAWVENKMADMGAHVIYSKMMDIHASGHAKQDDLKLVMALIKPKYLMPFHGESRMVRESVSLAKSLNYSENHVIVAKNGDAIDIGEGEVIVRRGATEVGAVFIDGLGIGDVGMQILNDRKRMTENGIVVLVFKVDPKTGKTVGVPEIVTRGFVFAKESSELLRKSQKVAQEAFDEAGGAKNKNSFFESRDAVMRAMTKFFRKQIDREPLIVSSTIRI